MGCTDLFDVEHAATYTRVTRTRCHPPTSMPIDILAKIVRYEFTPDDFGMTPRNSYSGGSVSKVNLPGFIGGSVHGLRSVVVGGVHCIRCRTLLELCWWNAADLMVDAEGVGPVDVADEGELHLL